MELVHRPVTVILALGGPAALAARVSTATIPILFQVGIDPVTNGRVASINRPNGNATGVSLVARELNAKKLELLHELLPTATGIGVLLNPSNPSIETFTSEVMEAASSLKQRIVVLKIGTDYDLDATLANLVEQRVYGLVVTDDPFFTNRRDRIAALAARHRIPAIYPWREYVVGAGEQRGRNFKAEPPCGLEVDHEFKLAWHNHWKLGGLLPPEDTTHIDATLAKSIGPASLCAIRSRATAAGGAEVPAGGSSVPPRRIRQL
jgi:hypothetical protein